MSSIAYYGRSRNPGKARIGGYRRRMPVTTSKSGGRYRGRVRVFRRGADRTSGYYGRYRGVSVGEKKFHDIDVDDATVAAAGAILNSGSINLIPQGTTEITRIGRKAVLRSINWRYEVFQTAGTSLSTASDVCRIILYLDKQCNGVTAAITDIIETADFQSFRNLANSGRFKILMDKNVIMNLPSAAGNGTANDTAHYSRIGSFYKKCNIPLEFSSTTGAITEIRSNNLGVLLITLAGNCGFHSKVRLRFTDS